MKKCYFLVGLPGVGKSTFTKDLMKKESNAVYLSTDYFLEKIAKEKNISYSKSWKGFADVAEKSFSALLRSSMNKGSTLIWDQTNTVKSARIKKIKYLKQKGYFVTGLSFELSEQEWMSRIKKREDSGGKTVPNFIISGMLKSYEKPAYNEGFDEIFVINELGELNLLSKNLGYSLDNELKIK